MHFYIDLHVFLMNKHYITLDNSYKLLYTVYKEMEADYFEYYCQ